MDINGCIKYLKTIKQPLKIMEVCGTHTSSIVKNGIRDLLPQNIRLVSGPGCPVCVTEAGFIDRLIEFSQKENSCVLSFGDMFKVRGTSLSFSEAKALGGNFQIIYSPFEAVTYAKNNPHINYAVAAVGFETTIPLYALLIDTLVKENINNIKISTSLKTMIPALSFICNQEAVDGFICPGHVSVIIGRNAYMPLCAEYNKPFVIAGFEPEHIIAAICSICLQIESKEFRVQNIYKSVVTDFGNETAQELINRYFISSDGFWRGIGKIKDSALVLKEEYSDFVIKNSAPVIEKVPTGCRCSDVLLGRLTPVECGLFATVCKSTNPVGACMTSQEGACAIWFNNMIG